MKRSCSHSSRVPEAPRRRRAGVPAFWLLVALAGGGTVASGHAPAAESVADEVPSTAALYGGPLPAEVAHALETIRSDWLLTHARELTDPAYRGRRAGSAGALSAADYIVRQFRDMGLAPGGAAGYYQNFKIEAGYQVTARLEAWLGPQSLGDYRRGVDFSVVHLPDGRVDLDVGLALAGYGISASRLGFDEYADLDARGKAVLVFSGAPWTGAAGAWLRQASEGLPLESLAYKARNAALHGAACLLVTDNPAGWRKALGAPERLRLLDADGRVESPIPILHVTRRVASDLTALSLTELRLLAGDIARDRASQSTPLRGRRVVLRASVSGRARMGRNLVAVLPGRDDRLRREAVVVGAHYDHLGALGEDIFFGANDNAAGVGAMLGVARAFTSLPRPPRRTLVFVAFDAEEIGRLGSKSYVERPALPIERTACMINFDMIGRNEPDAVYAVGTRSSPDLHRIHQAVNRHVGLTLVHPASFRLGRSDHSSFYYAGVPILYLFGGLDPDYNTPRDTWDRLIPGKVEKVARLAFLTALEVAQRNERIPYVPNPEAEAISLMRLTQ